MTTAKPRVGLIGSGAIADWHVRALRVAGFDVAGVASRPGSTRVKAFADRQGIPRVFDGWQAMLSASWDALVIATDTDATLDVLGAAVTLDVPTLVEKPVAWSATRLEKLSPTTHDAVIVGFNRRFYRTVEFAREFALDGRPLIAHLTLPESVDAEVDRSAEAARPFFSNSCHGLDLLRFVFGEIAVVEARRTRSASGGVAGIAALLESARGDTVQLTGNWGTPANFALTLDRPGCRVELRPFERALVYDGLEVIEPSDECPIRRYVPRLSATIDLDAVDRIEKPGFVRQARALRAMVDGAGAPPPAARLADALAAIRLCETLSGIRYD